MANELIPVLETERLVLLPWKTEYAEDMLALQCELNRADWTYHDVAVPDIKKARAAINDYIKHSREEWAIVLKSENCIKIIGQIGLRISANCKEFNQCYVIICYQYSVFSFILNKAFDPVRQK